MYLWSSNNRLVLIIVHVALSYYRLDGMKMGLQDIHLAERPGSYMLVELWNPDLTVGICLLLDVFIIKCNEVPNLTMIN